MSYSNKVTINGFEIIFKRVEGNFGFFLNLDNELIKTAISECSLLFFNTLFGNELLSMRETFEALECFNDKEHCLGEEPSPNKLYEFSQLKKLRHQAELVLNSEYANDNQKQNASHAINVLNTGLLERK
ncbi:hypothetical protein [uncultured Legionella sp.]|uniref:hypothetical protein n=1 Tax=uncultured Legionella sp. TaxID=210934 RepID=UPI002633519B|nr:hypothetical protein [uncultured Legionella sp.]